MRRRILIVVAVVVFLAVSLELARFLTAAGAEREDVFALLTAQARGDRAGMLARLPGCAADPRCAAEVAANARRLRRDGRPKILSLQSGTAYAIGRTTKPTRVAWAIVERNGPAVVQCVLVQREWSLLSGASVTLRRLGAPIDPEAPC